MSRFDAADLWFTEEGDLVLGDNGDLKDTTSVYGRSLLQEIRTRLKADKGDWKLHTSLGANLTSYLGEAATKRYVSLIGRAIVESLTYDRLLLPGDFEIIPLTLANGIVLFRLVVKTAEGELIANFGYDSDRSRFMGY